MSGVVLFCTAEAARPVGSVILFVGASTDNSEAIVSLLEPKPTHNGSSAPEESHCKLFFLAEDRTPPADGQLRESLEDDGSFTSDFIGAAPVNCQQWMREHGSNIAMCEDNLLAIADHQTAVDGTVLVQYYAHAGRSEHEFEGFGVLPQVADKWYDFRIDPEWAWAVTTDLSEFGVCETVMPTYFGCKDDLTNDKGIFDGGRAHRIVGGEEPLPCGRAVHANGKGRSYLQRLAAAQH